MDNFPVLPTFQFIELVVAFEWITRDGPFKTTKSKTINFDPVTTKLTKQKFWNHNNTIYQAIRTNSAICAEHKQQQLHLN